MVHPIPRSQHFDHEKFNPLNAYTCANGGMVYTKLGVDSLSHHVTVTSDLIG